MSIRIIKKPEQVYKRKAGTKPSVISAILWGQEVGLRT